MTDDSRLPGCHVRPWVTFPDWTAVTAPHAREAMLAIFEAIGIESMWRDYTPAATMSTSKSGTSEGRRLPFQY